MTQTADNPLRELRARMRGEVIGAGDPTYDDSRRVWNAGIDRRPLMVARCADEADVQAVVRLRRASTASRSRSGAAHTACPVPPSWTTAS